MMYFTIDELCRSYTAQQHGIANTPNAEETAHLTELVDRLLDPLREHLGMPINVNSGFRCEELNTLVGGSKTSAHRVGYAADIHVSGVTYKTLRDIIVGFCKDCGIKYDQIFSECDAYSQWVHIGYKNQQGEQRMQSGDWVKNA